MLTCFVITGYGLKKDYINNRDIDLDKTFKHIIRPVFTDLGYECKRSSDYPPGMIDTIMYKGIYNADFVIADISTLNPNALYELGVRHALKPYSTLVICEDGIFINDKLPFDLSHLSAMKYHHDGKSLDIDEVERFKEVLKKAVTGMINAHEVDSPVFTHLEGLQVMVKVKQDFFTQVKDPGVIMARGGEGQDESNKAKSSDDADKSINTPTLSEMIDHAMEALKNQKFEKAKVAFEQLLEIKPGDEFFVQQLCLATYKSDEPDPVTANHTANRILEQLNPLSSTNTTTLGLAGAIYKNLYKLTGDKACLEKSLRFYERGYYIASDYYNGINTVFLYWKLASLSASKEEALFFKIQAKKIGKDVVEICNNLKQQQEDYAKRKDKEWVSNTLAEAYCGLDDTDNFNQLEPERKKEQNYFSEESFMKQLKELKAIKEMVEGFLK
jgi:hypothetical protein